MQDLSKLPDLSILPPKPLPRVSMYDPIPKELLRNLPPWVGKLQTFAYLLMLPFAIVLIAAYAMQALGYF